jgi:hypothetical protein
MRKSSGKRRTSSQMGFMLGREHDYMIVNARLHILRLVVVYMI